MFGQASVQMQNPVIHANAASVEPCIFRSENLERDRGMMRIDEGKGLKDRYTLLSKTAVAIVDHYLKTHRIESSDFFPGRQKLVFLIS